MFTVHQATTDNAHNGASCGQTGKVGIPFKQSAFHAAQLFKQTGNAILLHVGTVTLAVT